MDISPPKSFDRSLSRAIAGGWGMLIVLVVLAYWPGLRGPFVLDDFDAISALGALGGVTDWATFKAFVFGGHSGPTGRPLALLSFLVDAHDWPTDPLPFKRTNLVIHLLNGALLGLLISRILDLLQFDKRNARWVALVSAAAWLLHPFLVSTTLYVVQRMAQLATLFVLAGLVVHLRGRSFLSSDPKTAYLVMSGSVGLFTLLAMLCKENGVLLPILIGVVEATVVASQRPRLAALNRYWLLVFVILPAIIVAIYLASKFFAASFFDVLPPRDFSAYERFLTQPRILLDYLQHWFVPELYTSGVFQDHFATSSGFFSPPGTALSAALVAVIVAVAVLKRRRWPLFSLAALFFFASHLLESTVLNLELYFEHRNYLAAAFLFLPLVVLLQQRAGRRLFVIIAASALLVLAGFTRYSATVWQDYPSLVEASARKAPTSARAQAEYAVQLFNAERYDEALFVIDNAIVNAPRENPMLQVNRLVLLCNLGILESDDFNRAADLVSGAIYDTRWLKLYTALTDAVSQQLCPAVPTDALRSMFTNMLAVKENANPQSLAYSHLKYFVGLIDISTDRPEKAVREFEESLQAEPGAEKAMAMAAQLAANKYFEQALHFSDLALSSLSDNPNRYLQPGKVRESDIRAFQAMVRAEIPAASREAGSLKATD